LRQRLRPFVTPSKLYARREPLGAWMQVGDERFNSNEIQRLYEAVDYPLRKA
jgi:hypothetical protein